MSDMYHDPINLLRERQQPNSSKKTFITMALVVVFLGALFLWHRHSTLKEWPSDATAYDAATLKPKRTGILNTVKNFIFHSDNVLVGEANDRINILLLGIGGPGHDGPYLSDTNIIISLKPSTHEVALISVPRDLAAKVNEHGVRKINSADAFGELAAPGQGGEYARKIFEETFNLNIPYYIRVDFKAFTELVDAVGGITVEVPKTFTDTAFPGPNFSYRTIHFDAGKQILDGQSALDYSRSRHGNNGEGSDFARAKRQQLVLESLKAKLLTLGTYTNPLKVQDILSSLTAHVSTNFNFGQLMYLGTLARSIEAAPKQLVLDDSPNGFLTQSIGNNGAYLLSPKEGNFDKINLAVQNIFDNTANANNANTATGVKIVPQLATAGLEIQNGTWRAGLAAQLKQDLEKAGVPILSVGNSSKRPIDKTTLYRLNNDVKPAVITAITKIIPAITTDTLPVWLDPNYENPTTTGTEHGIKYNTAADLLLIIGTDFK